MANYKTSGMVTDRFDIDMSREDLVAACLTGRHYQGRWGRAVITEATEEHGYRVLVHQHNHWRLRYEGDAMVNAAAFARVVTGDYYRPVY